MYSFLTGPALWFTLPFFIGGVIIRIVYLFGLSQGKDSVLYNHMDFAWGVKSIIHWLIPWASLSMRLKPIFTFFVFTFHVPLLIIPLFLNAHNQLWAEAFGCSLWSLPDQLTDIMTVILIISGIILLARRFLIKEVRIITGFADIMLLIITILPFITGFLAYHQWGPKNAVFLLHVISGHILLITIPFSKLAHFILFFFTRAFIGFEMGTRRGVRTW